MNACRNFSDGVSIPSITEKPVRGALKWTTRVLELIDRDRMDDFEERHEPMSIPFTDKTQSADDEQSMEAILARIRKLYQAEPEAARPRVPGRPMDQSRRPDPAPK